MRYPLFISNHEDMRSLVEWHGIPFDHVPVDKNDKVLAFAEVERLVEEAEADSIVLARYMQILPPSLCSGRPPDQHPPQLPAVLHRCQALPSGLRPRGEADRRYCHYVTEELDAGPIIEQDIHLVTHCHTAEDLVRIGA